LSKTYNFKAFFYLEDNNFFLF